MLAALGARGRVTAALTWLQARDGDDKPLLRRPDWSGSLTIDGPVIWGIDGAASLVWVGSRDDLDPVTYARVSQEGFVTANATATVPLGSGFSARLRVENLANHQYEEVRGYPAPGRRVLLGLMASVH